MIDKLISTPVDKTVDFVGKAIKGLVIKGCGITGEVCIITFGLFVIWLVINKDSVIAKEGLAGSIVVYIGTKLVELMVK